MCVYCVSGEIVTGVSKVLDLYPGHECSSNIEGEEWTCRWLNGEPVGKESSLESADGSRRSIIVPDHRLPPGWEKHLTQRMWGNSAGKWDTILVNPEGKKFHTRNVLKQWLEENKLDYNMDRFDFCLHINRARKLGLYEVTDPEALAAASKAGPPKIPNHNKTKNTPSRTPANKSGTPKTIATAALPETPDLPLEDTEEDGENAGSLKIIMINDSYKCPIEGCGKNFRRENLAQMHIKHYHPEYSKLMGSTPNVADLAYARTVGEPIDERPVKTKPLAPILDKITKQEILPKQKSTLKVLTPKVALKPEEDAKKVLEKNPVVVLNPMTIPKPVTKDSEIIRLLNSEPKSKSVDSLFDSPGETTNSNTSENISSTAPVTKPPEKHPEIKLKDLLYKAEPIPMKRDDPPKTGGIKTLLPVIRTVKEEPNIPDSDIDPELLIKTHSVARIPEKGRPGRKRKSYQASEVFKKRQPISQMSYKYEADEMSDYYEADSHSQDSFYRINDHPLVLPPAQEIPQVIIEGGEVIRLVHMRSEEIINCTCGITEEDGLMIQCELCLCWQHAHCNNIQRENEVPDKYVCYICKHPQRMRASKKYMHDQDWLKQGTLATANYHAKDEEKLAARFEKLRNTHELTGRLNESREYVHNLRIQLSIAENKNHPKLYLWAKPWDKTANIPAKQEPRDEKPDKELERNFTGSDHSYIKGNAFSDMALKSMLEPPLEIKEEKKEVNHSLIDSKIQSQSELISILEDNDIKPEINNQVTEFPKIDLNTMIANSLPEKELKEEVLDDNKELALSSTTSGLLSSGSLDLALTQSDLDRLSTLAQAGLNEEVLSGDAPPQTSHIPQPEAAIDPADCKLNLLSHIAHCQSLAEKRMDEIEAEIIALEKQELKPIPDENDEFLTRTKQTMQMMLRDLCTMRQISAVTN